jgi:putative ABC transport system substrate-binding protein
MAIHIRRREFIATLRSAAMAVPLAVAAQQGARLLGLVVAFGLAGVPLSINAQQSTKLPRLGWLPTFAATSPVYDGFRQGLRELGYVEGKNIIIETRWAEGNLDRLPELARELAGLNVDVMLVAGDQGLRAAKEATTTIPIIVSACDPLDSLVASIARPGGKATGLTCISSELVAKRLQLLKELVPALSRVAVLYNPEDRNKAWEYKQVQEAARSLKLAVHAYEARSAAEIDKSFAGIVDQHDQALVIFADVLLGFHQGKLADLALQNRLPAIFGFREFADLGGLISYGASLREQYRRAAWYVDKILKGANPGDLPIEQPTRFELVINLKTAKALGIEVPLHLQQIADDVIE